MRAQAGRGTRRLGANAAQVPARPRDMSAYLRGASFAWLAVLLEICILVPLAGAQNCDPAQTNVTNHGTNPTCPVDKPVCAGLVEYCVECVADYTLPIFEPYTICDCPDRHYCVGDRCELNPKYAQPCSADIDCGAADSSGRPYRPPARCIRGSCLHCDALVDGPLFCAVGVRQGTTLGCVAPGYWSSESGPQDDDGGDGDSTNSVPRGDVGRAIM